MRDDDAILCQANVIRIGFLELLETEFRSLTDQYNNSPDAATSIDFWARQDRLHLDLQRDEDIFDVLLQLSENSTRVLSSSAI